MKVKVLYVEDEPFLGRIVSETLLQQGFDVNLVKDGNQVLDTIVYFAPDICVLDIMLPNIDGYTLCREIRSQYAHLPVIFLTARSETSDVVMGFEAGGSDYLRKPFSTEELIARINNQVKRTNVYTIPQNQDIDFGVFRLSVNRYELSSPSALHKLSAREKDILQFLVTSANRIVDRRDLLLSVWGDDSFFNSRTLDVYIRKLRNLLAEDTNIEIVTLKAKGYLFLVK